MSAVMDVSDQPEGSVSDAGRYALGLTEPGSHVLIREAGRGDLVIGPAGMGKKADLHVARRGDPLAGVRSLCHAGGIAAPYRLSRQ